MRTVLLCTLVAVIASAATATADHLITGERIAKSTITHRHIDNGSLGGWDIRDGTIASRDLREGAIELASLEEATVAQLQETNATTRAENTAPIAGGRYVGVTVACPEGKVAVGGGAVIAEHAHNGRLTASYPVADAEGRPTQWAVVMRNDDTQPGTIQAYAVCA